MIVGIASDHRGFKLKEKIKKYLIKKKVDFIDFGTDSGVSVDYNDYALKVCEAVNSKEIDYGILICGTGIGMSIMANKVKGIMCAKVDNAKEARLAREHNNANVISFSADMLLLEAKDIIDSYLKSSFLEEDKYVRRVEKIKDQEKLKRTVKKK
jgi:ribose 5-phosphate isomerase B